MQASINGISITAATSVSAEGMPAGADAKTTNWRKGFKTRNWWTIRWVRYMLGCGAVLQRFRKEHQMAIRMLRAFMQMVVAAGAGRRRNVVCRCKSHRITAVKKY
jgi:hypothetical protein